MAEEKLPATRVPEHRFVFGPVASRRLGRSLGVDPVPFKTCNENCVYCQLGRTSPLKYERARFFPPEEILRELRARLDELGEGALDWITFVGSGETTLSSDLGLLVRAAKAMSAVPVAVITNGSLLHLPTVREELLHADAVLTSLDAGTPELFRKVNRPHPGVTFERVLEGLHAFRAMYRGRLLIEVMLVRELNDTEEALNAIGQALDRVRPDEIHLSAPVRPPAEPWVRPTDAEGIERARRILGGTAVVLADEAHLSTPGRLRPARDALVAVVQRHPLRVDDVGEILAGYSPQEREDAVSNLLADGAIQEVVRGGVRFFAAQAARFPTDRE